MTIALVKNESQEVEEPAAAQVAAKCAGAVISLGGRILLVRPKIGQETTFLDEWLLPKGHIEPGESAREAAIREAREETGATLSIEAAGPLLTTTSQVIKAILPSGEIQTEDQEVAWFIGHAALLRSEDQTDIRHIGLFTPMAAMALLSHLDHRKVLAAAIEGTGN